MEKIQPTNQPTSQPLRHPKNGVSDTDWPTLVIARHKHSHRISLISSDRYRVPREWRVWLPEQTPGTGLELGILMRS